MINAIVTVGTTSFDTLTCALDKSSDKVALYFQIAHGKSVPIYHPSDRFRPNIQTLFREADFVITHAGAGTVFFLLEAGIRFLVVPNLERADKHQVELARFLVENRYAACFDVRELAGMSLDAIAEHVLSEQYERYQTEKFNMVEGIVKYFLRG